MTAVRPRPPVPMDPRIRARRVAVRRTEGRRRLRLLLVALASFGTLAAGWGVTRSPVLDVDHVVVRGADRTDRPTLLRAAGLAGSPQLADIDPGTVARRVERLPWVASAAVSRAWPATVTIEIVERRAVAAVPAGEHWAEVDDAGRVLAIAPRPADGLPALEGVEAGAVGSRLAGVGRDAVTVAAALPEALHPSVASVRVGPDGVELALVPRGRAILGDTRALRDKLVAVATVLRDVEQAKTVRVLDVRVPSAPVLTRR